MPQPTIIEAQPELGALSEQVLFTEESPLTTNRGVVLRDYPDPDCNYEALLIRGHDGWRFPGSALTALQSGNPNLSASEQTYLETGLWISNLFHLVGEHNGSQERFWSHHVDNAHDGRHLACTEPVIGVKHASDIGWFSLTELLSSKDKLPYSYQEILLQAARQRRDWDRQPMPLKRLARTANL